MFVTHHLTLCTTRSPQWPNVSMVTGSYIEMVVVVLFSQTSFPVFICDSEKGLVTLP